LVLEPNYRGSAGYGAAFRSLDIRNLGIGEMSDVMAGIDHLISQDLADPTRLAAMGSS
jgi:dipeptidyl aminopeptidase/acylaminoacyl peptidase